MRWEGFVVMRSYWVIGEGLVGVGVGSKCEG